MDFTLDTLADGRAFRTLNIVDDYMLERLRATHGLSQSIMLDNGPEFAGRTLEAWAYTAKVTLCFIRPGKPIENAYVESFNGKFRDECLNEHWFVSLADAQARSKRGVSTTTPCGAYQNGRLVGVLRPLQGAVSTGKIAFVLPKRAMLPADLSGP